MTNPSGESAPTAKRARRDGIGPIAAMFMPDQEADTPPQRRLHLSLDMGADYLQELCSALSTLANDLLYDGREQQEQHSGGYSTGHHLVLTVTDEAMDGDTFRSLLAEWSAARKAAASGRTGCGGSERP